MLFNSCMLLTWKIFIGVAVALFGGAGVLLYLGYGLQDVSFVDLELNGIKEITLSSFTLRADLLLHNPSDLSVPVKEVRYTIYDSKTNKEVSSGLIPGFELTKKATSRIPFEQQIKFGPTAFLAASLVTDEKMYVLVKGEVFLDVAGARENAIPFEKEVEIKQYMKVPGREETKVSDADSSSPSVVGGLLG